jgi:poly(A) polymerase/tRNA nucleotidyltransferase (CCA-adding enzyme)
MKRKEAKNVDAICRFEIPEVIVKAHKTLKGAGFEAYLVGGCTRDLFLHRKPKDWDLTTNATPDKIMELFPKSFYENEYGTVGVVFDTDDETLKVLEITPYRLESVYSDNRRPDKVYWGKKLEDDLKRRDFTINAIALDIVLYSQNNVCDVRVIDIFGGIKDLRDGIVRTVGEPEERFGEDGLRVIRAVRIATELGFRIEGKTEKAVSEKAYVLSKIAKERVRDEFIKIVMSSDPMNGILLLQKSGLLRYIMPELEKCMGVTQNQAHIYDVFEHSLRALAHSAKKNNSLKVRLAVLLHDIGKPATREWSKEKNDWTFHGHDVVGAKIAAKILTNLKFSKKDIEDIVKLVRWHMFFSDTERITLSAVRRMIARVGKENIWELMEVRAADRIGTGRPKESPYRLRKYHAMIEEAMRDPISVSALKIGGNDVMAVTGLKPGPKIGFILNILLDDVIENPNLNDKNTLLERAKNLSGMSDDELKELADKAKARKEAEEYKEIEKIRQKYWVK